MIFCDDFSIFNGEFDKGFYFLFGCVLIAIPMVDVPFRYRTTHLAASTCPLLGDAVYYLVSMLVMVDMSGRVEVDSQVSNPTMYCILRVRASCDFGSIVDGIECDL